MRMRRREVDRGDTVEAGRASDMARCCKRERSVGRRVCSDALFVLVGVERLTFLGW